jgi:hypothetical protein
VEDLRLMNAAREGNVATARFLLDRGARMEVVDSNGFNALSQLCGKPGVARLLLDKGVQQE